jgi:heptaprenyl diphosphate synthase
VTVSESTAHGSPYAPTSTVELGEAVIAEPALGAAVKLGLDRVEKLMHDELRSELGFVTQASLHLVDAGGKRFRPLFTLLAAQLGNGDSDEVVRAAAVVELVHLATLYHDDVMDEATMRRGAASANARWDNTVAILTGDYLFANASRLVADLGPEAVRIIARTFAKLVTGQMQESLGPQPGDDPVEHYLRVVTGKTGSLIATAGRFGGMFAGLPIEQVTALARYGEFIGVAFQISDDIIDIASPAAESGKTPGIDLREGVRTLPMLYALADSPSGRLAELLAAPISDDSLLDEALVLLRASTGLERARRTVASFAGQARDTLVVLPAAPATEALHALTQFVVERTR